jgi:ABC-2 type transport system permease protein
VFDRTARRTVRSGLVWGFLFGIVVASSAVSYTKIYTTQSERDALATAFGMNHAAAALFGPAPQLQTVAGFTVFKSFMTIMILGALWGLLTSTRVLRGEEDAGRWELVLTGQTTQRRATLNALTALAAGAGALWLVTAVITVLVGTSSQIGFGVGQSLYFALAQAATAVMFLAVGALTSQLAATRRQAATLAGWALGASYILRMVADAGVGLHGLIWVTPLGWAEELQPLTDPRPAVLLPIAAFTVGVSALAVHLAGVRDVGASTWRDRTHVSPRLRLLSGQIGLSMRLVRPVVLAWIVALAATGVVLGLIAKQAGGTIAGSSVQEVFTRLGASGTGAEAFLGISFLIVAVLAGFMAAGQVTAARTEEAEGRLDALVVAPVSRVAWLGGRVLLGVVVVTVGGLVAGLCTWLGTESQGTGVGLGTLLQAGINVVPPALCLLGLGVFAIGVWPRGTSFVVYGILGWSLLIEVVGGFGSGSRWLLDTSLYHQMAAAPAVSPQWTVNGVMIAIAACGTFAGGLCFRRRDLEKS